MEASIQDCATEVNVMSIRTESRKSIGNPLVLAMLLAVSFPPAGALADGAARTSITRHTAGGRDDATAVIQSVEEYGALVADGDRDVGETRGAAAGSGAGSSVSKPGSYDFWFYEADVILFNDDDSDGYYHGIDLLFDVDTIYSSADVYAVLYLSLDGGPWNEYGITEDFLVSGTSGADEYVMVTELMSGYPTGSYDLLIELFDAYDGAFLASFGPEDTSELAWLALEDYERDAPPPETRIIVNNGSGGGGAIDGWFIAVFLLLLFGSGIRRIWRHRNDALMRIDSPAPCWQHRPGKQRHAKGGRRRRRPFEPESGVCDRPFF
jgi:hypothetical protein